MLLLRLLYFAVHTSYHIDDTIACGAMSCRVNTCVTHVCYRPDGWWDSTRYELDMHMHDIHACFTDHLHTYDAVP